MWHIPINATERSLLYAADTFEEFVSLLQFFNKLDTEENGAWWEELTNDVVASDDADSDSYDNEYDENYDTPERETDEPKELVTMEPISANSLMSEESFEIEHDMRISFRPQKGGKVSVQDYVENIAARYPLLGMAVLDENSQQAVEKVALETIRILLDHKEVYSWGHLAIFLTMLQYARNWNRASNAGFWAYIAEQFGYKDSQQLYGVLTTSVKEACRSYNRLFVVDPNGDNNYYSTALAHAIAPSKSVFALFDFLLKFYHNNLDCSVYGDDPAIGRMICVLRDRCNGASVEQDDDIRGNVYGIQVGLKVLLTTRPGYMRRFVTKILQKMRTILDGGELPGREHIDHLLTQWYIGKMSEPVSPTSTYTYTPTVKRVAPAHKRTTDIAFSYGKIKVEYILGDDNEPALRIPSIRLSSHENPVLKIFSCGDMVYQHTIDIYGNDYAATSEEVVVPLSDIDDVDFRNLEVELSIGDKAIFASESSLNVKALIFRDNKLQVDKTLNEGNYTLFAPKQASIKFQGNVERQRLTYFAQLYNIYIQGEVSIFADGSLLCCSRPPEGSLRFRLPQTQIEYVLRDTAYPIYSRGYFSVTAVGNMDSGNVAATLQNGERLSVESSDGNLWQFSSPTENGGYSLTLTDSDSGRVFDEVKFYIIDSYSVSFDSLYYLETSEDGNVTLDINREHFELSLTGFGAKAKIPYGKGEIHILIPRIRMLLDGESLPMEAVWKGEIAPNSQLRVLCPESLPVSLAFGDTQIKRGNTFGGYDYAIGNSVQAYDGTADKVSVSLFVAGDKLPMFDVVFKMSLTEPLQFNLTNNTMTWLNSHAFMGDQNTTLKFVFQPKRDQPIVLYSGQGEKILSEDFPAESERYQYQVFAQSETAFGLFETLLVDGYAIFGERAAVIFRGETLRIDRVLLNREGIEIKPVYADNITFVGIENLGYFDLSGDYAHYTAKLFFITQNGKRYFTDLNPVDIYLVNEKSGLLHISFNDGDGLFIYRSSGYKAELYKHTDPPQQLKPYVFFPDFFEFQYSKEMR